MALGPSRTGCDATPVLEKAGFSVAATSFGRFKLARFLIPIPSLRETAIERIRTQIVQAIQRHRPDCISVIAHSFGTFVVAKIIERDPEIRWNRVIFCGSVLPENFPFHQYEGRFREILNEIGAKDVLPAFAQSVTWGYGSIGTHGLNNPAVKNRWHYGLSHSDFLKPEFIEKFWVPFLQKGEALPGGRAQPSQLALLVSALPLRWIILLFAAMLAFF
jgi:pimeloyl-ACP methyl ester carboxylesterase